MNTLLSSLQKQRLVWSAKQAPADTKAFVSTGFDELDSCLDGGWPQTGVVALNSLLGIGEMRLLLPYLQQRCQQEERLLVLINPPHEINAEMLCERDITTQQVIIVYCEDRQGQLWCAEQCLKSGCCATVLMWQTQLQHHQVKRFQLAAQQGDALLFVFHHQQAGFQGLPFSLALTLTPVPTGLDITMTKRQGGWPTAPFTLNFQHVWPRLTDTKAPSALVIEQDSRVG